MIANPSLYHLSQSSIEALKMAVDVLDFLHHADMTRADINMINNQVDRVLTIGCTEVRGDTILDCFVDAAEIISGKL
jgi:cyclopropane fatty-acyl-phospholipid synthase-like methyltransferase